MAEGGSFEDCGAGNLSYRGSQRHSVASTPERFGWPPSSSGLGRRPFKAVARVRIPLGVHGFRVGFGRQGRPQRGPVAQLVSAPPCHGGGRGFESRQGRRIGVKAPALRWHCFTGAARPGSSVGTSVRLKSGRSPVRSRPWPPLFTCMDTGYALGCRFDSSGSCPVFGV